MKSTQELLISREISGLKFILIFRVTYIFLMAGLHVFTDTDIFERYFSLVLSLVVLFFTLIAFYMMAKKIFLHFIGIGGLLLDLTMVAFLPFLWYNQVGGWESVPSVFLVKSPSIISLSMIIILYNGFASFGLYPLLASFGIVLINAALYFLAAHDPRTIFASDVVGHILGQKFNPQLFIATNMSYLISGISFSYFLRRNRKVINDVVHLERSNEQISKYFSPKIFEHIIAPVISEQVQTGRLQKVAVLFSDLKGFTSMSEKLPADKVVRFLSDYHEKMVAAIFKNGGTLDKFIGDGIMATFGTPIEGTDDARRALQCASDMRNSLNDLNKIRIENGQPILSQRIGIHYGDAIAGNIGTANRMEYTVIGDTVNIAARLEKAAKSFAVDIIFSENLLNALNQAEEFRCLGKVTLRGKENPIQVYTLKS